MGTGKHLDSYDGLELLGDYLRVVLVQNLAILKDLFLAREHRVVQLDSVIAVVESELPDEEFLGSAIVNDVEYLRGDGFSNVSNIRVEWLATHFRIFKCGENG